MNAVSSCESLNPNLVGLFQAFPFIKRSSQSFRFHRPWRKPPKTTENPKTARLSMLEGLRSPHCRIMITRHWHNPREKSHLTSDSLCRISALFATRPPRDCMYWWVVPYTYLYSSESDKALKIPFNVQDAQETLQSKLFLIPTAKQMLKQ